MWLWRVVGSRLCSAAKEAQGKVSLMVAQRASITGGGMANDFSSGEW